MNESTKNPHIVLENITKMIPVALAFLMPLFFLPTTTEFFEFNKLALLTIGTLLLIVLWATRILTGQKIEFIKSTTDLPLMALTLVMALATIFSIHKTTSIYGSQGRWFPSLFGFLVLLAYYFFATPSLKDTKAVKGVLIGFLGATGISSLVSLLSYFNIFLGSSDYLRIQNFSLTGSITTTALIAAVGIIIALSLAAYEKLLPLRIVYCAIAGLNFFFVALVNSPAGWVALVAGIVAVLMLVDSNKFAENKLTFLVLSGVLAALLMIIFVPTTRAILVNKNYPQELNLPLRESWVVASSTIQDYPILATGPSTFGLNFTRYRPLSLNNQETWNIRFDKPYNEILNIIGTLGIVGLIVSGYFLAKVLQLIGKTRLLNDETGMTKISAAALVAVIASFLVTYATVLNTFLFFMFLGAVVAAQALLSDAHKSSEVVAFTVGSLSPVSTIGEMSVVKKEYFRYILAVPVFLLVGYVGYLGYKNYMGEYYMRQSIVAAKNNDATKIYEFQRMAITANPTRDAYQSAYARTNLVLANALAGKKDLTDADKQTIQGLIAQAIRSARIVTEVISPVNVTNWETRSLVYSSIVGVAQNAGDWAVSSYNTAIQLDPTNPRLRLDLGGIYYANGDYLSAANLFRQATTLKSDYANAHYNFAQALIKLNDVQGAVTELQITKSLVPQDSEDAKQVDKEIAELSKQPQVAGAASNKPTVEQLTGSENQAQAPKQEPLSNVSEQNKLNGQELNLQALPQPTATPTPVATPTPTPTPVKK